LPLSLPPYGNLGSDALFTCDICLYIPVDSTLLYSSVALECKLSSSALQIPTETSRKLDHSIAGLFEITKKIGNLYEVKLLDTIRSYNVFSLD
jgi:hypothetical protein